MRNIDEIISDYSGRKRRVLDYSQLMGRKVTEAKQPGFSEQNWAPLGELVDKDCFERVGNFREVMDYDGYVAFLTQWAMKSEWECSFKGIWEQGDRVFLELEERAGTGDQLQAVNSLSVYDFDANDKIVHVDIFLQMAMPGPEILKNYEGIA